MAIVAPTGVSAINARGMVINSLFQIKPGIHSHFEKVDYADAKFGAEKRALLKAIELLIVDEVSMVRVDLLMEMDRICRHFGEGSKPFGGKQVLLIGDPFQLPPIVDREQSQVFYQIFKSPFFFSEHYFWNLNPVPIELTKIYRQNDLDFINLLNGIRTNDFTDEQLVELNKRVVNRFDFVAEKFLFLGTTNAQVQSVNQGELDKLNTALHSYEASITGRFDKDFPALQKLDLKVGAQIMFIKNDTNKRWFNGKTGKVKRLSEHEIEVELPEGNSVLVEREVWEKIRYEWDAKAKKVVERVDGTFTQYPLKLAWAITVHKSQGLSLERVYLDVSNAWDFGQVYVALSRATTYTSLKLAQPIGRSAIRVSSEVEGFYKWVEAETAKQERPPVFIEPLVASKKLVTKENDPVMLSWKVSGAEKVVLDPGGLDVTNFNAKTVYIRYDTKFILRAISAYGVETSQNLLTEVSKEPPKIIIFEADRQFVLSSQPVLLRWQVENAHMIEIVSFDDSQTLPSTGHTKVFISERTVFRLVATTFFGVKKEAAVSVDVVPVPLLKTLFVPSIQINSTIHIQIEKPKPPVELESHRFARPDFSLPFRKSIWHSPTVDRGFTYMKQALNSFFSKFKSTTNE